MKNAVDIKKAIERYKKEIKEIGGKDWNEVRIYRRLIEELKWVLSDKGGEKVVVESEDKGGRDEGVLQTGQELH